MVRAFTGRAIVAATGLESRVAALGENLILLANLAGSAFWYWRLLRGRVAFAVLEQWQIAFLPVYCAWAAFVIVDFPPLFGYR